MSPMSVLLHLVQLVVRLVHLRGDGLGLRRLRLSPKTTGAEGSEKIWRDKTGKRKPRRVEEGSGSPKEFPPKENPKENPRNHLESLGWNHVAQCGLSYMSSQTWRWTFPLPDSLPAAPPSVAPPRLVRSGHDSLMSIQLTASVTSRAQELDEVIKNKG